MSLAARPSPLAQPVTTDVAVTAHRRRMLLAWVVALMVVATFALWAAGPYLSGEFRRLEPWQVAAVCCGDAVAALWFLRFGATHLLLGRPLVDEPAGPHARRAVTLFLISMIGGLMLDMGVTVYLRHVEHRRYAASPGVTAEVSEMRTNHASHGRNYALDCAWRHPETGQTHHVTLRVHAMMPRDGHAEGDGFPMGMPGDVVRALAADRAPARVPVRYDPRWPARSWLEGVPEDDNGLFFVSLGVHAAQAVAAALIALAAWGQAFGRDGSRLVPWWLELSQAVPTAAQVVAIAFMGAVFRVFGH